MEVEEEKQWKILIEFLEREARVHLKRDLIQWTNLKATARQEDQIKNNKHIYNQGVHLVNSNVRKICSFCGEGDHVTAAEPNHTEIFNAFHAERFLIWKQNIDLLRSRTEASFFSVYTLERIKIVANTKMVTVKRFYEYTSNSWQVSKKEACLRLCRAHSIKR